VFKVWNPDFDEIPNHNFQNTNKLQKPNSKYQTTDRLFEI